MDPVVAAIVTLWRELHGELRRALRELDAAELNWTPGPETNSAAVLVTHLLGSGQEMFRIARGLPSDRDRPSEFKVRAASVAELEQRLDAADAGLEAFAAGVSAEDLAAGRLHPRRGETRSGAYWLLNNLGHAREHVGALQLTHQLYRQQHGG